MKQINKHKIATGVPVVAFLAFAGLWGLANYNSWTKLEWVFVGAALGAIVGSISSLVDYFLFKRSGEKLIQPMTDIGIRSIYSRGTRETDEWTQELKRVEREMVFFGKDHSKLLENQLATLEDCLKSEDKPVQVHFYLLSKDAPYYQAADKKKELEDRNKARATLDKLRDELTKKKHVWGNRLSISEYDDDPRFSYTRLDNTVYFGIYLPRLSNELCPEFEVVKPSEEGVDPWFFNRCEEAFSRITTKEGEA